MMLSNKPQRKT